MAVPIYSNTAPDVDAVKDTFVVTTYFETEPGNKEVCARIVLSKWAATMMLATLDRVIREPAPAATVTPFPKKKRKT